MENVYENMNYLLTKLRVFDERITELEEEIKSDNELFSSQREKIETLSKKVVEKDAEICSMNDDIEFLGQELKESKEQLRLAYTTMENNANGFN